MIMKNIELYNKTVDILVQAYLNDTLQHENCAACAVGNIVAANTGVRLSKGSVGWVMAENGNSADWYKAVEFGLCGESAMAQINQTGYGIGDLTRIERAFESERCGNDDKRMFNGLMAVIEVLDQIHENTDTAITTAQKNRFIKPITA